MPTPFVPKTYTNGTRQEVANSAAEEADLLWRGWYLVGTYTPPVVPPFTTEQLTALRAALVSRSPAATYTYEQAPDGSKRIKTETKDGVTMTYVYDDANGGRVKTQSDGTTTWTFAYDTDSLITGVAA